MQSGTEALESLSIARPGRGSCAVTSFRLVFPFFTPFKKWLCNWLSGNICAGQLHGQFLVRLCVKMNFPKNSSSELPI